MSDRVICDSCSSIIFADNRHCTLTIRVESRYGSDSRREEKIDLCRSCDEKVADALLPYLKHLAGKIDPNAFGRARDRESAPPLTGSNPQCTHKDESS